MLIGDVTAGVGWTTKGLATTRLLILKGLHILFCVYRYGRTS